MTQIQALSIMKTGANVFLTGEPGSGKTHTVNHFAEYLRERGVEPAITASTGIAATHIGGMTIHSWSGIGIKTKLDEYDLDRIASSAYIVKRVMRAKVLVIDEVSMLSAETLSMIDAVCREIRRSSEPFGGVQAVMVGDFFQLPPIVKAGEENVAQVALLERGGFSARGACLPDGQGPDIGGGEGGIEESSARFAYASPAWRRASPVVCYLTEQYRQDDYDFLSILSSIRRNSFGDDQLRHIETRKIEHRLAPNGAPKLFSHNIDVDRVNDEMLAKLPDKSRAFAMLSRGPEPLIAALKKGCLSPETLYLKSGAAVMFVKNNPKKGFVNGTLGTIEGFNKASGYPVVKTRSGGRIEVEPMDWTVEENGKARARITQFPLRLAWAITVHKSQGMSLDEATMDLSQVFEFGQGYVALSRLRRLSGLYLLGWNERAFQVHPGVYAKDEDFRAASDDAETVFGKIPPAELEKMHKNFITSCGGKNTFEHPMPGSASIKRKSRSETSFVKIREKYPNAYQPWDEAQDEKLRELFTENLSVSDLAKIFGRKDGAIRSRLAKLELMEY